MLLKGCSKADTSQMCPFVTVSGRIDQPVTIMNDLSRDPRDINRNKHAQPVFIWPRSLVQCYHAAASCLGTDILRCVDVPVAS